MRVSHWIARALGAVAALAVIASLSACSSPQQNKVTQADSKTSSSLSNPHFPGPWGSEMDQMVKQSHSQFAAKVFADGKITQQEFDEAKQMVQDCYAASGIKASWDQYGQLTFSDGSDSNQPPSAQCSAADGGVMIVYYEMLVDPQNQNMMDLRAACLVKAGIVQPGYTGADLQHAYDISDLPWPSSDYPTATKCMLDPLGLVDSTTPTSTPVPGAQ